MTKRSPIPPMVQQLPLCPVCSKTVGYDGTSWWCEPCSFTWDSDAYDTEGHANPAGDQCPAEVMPYVDDQSLRSIRYDRYRCLRDAGHPVDGWAECHVGARSDGRPNYDGEPFEWRDGDYPQWTGESAGQATLVPTADVTP